MVAGAILAGCRASPNQQVHPSIDAGTRPDKMMQQFFRDNVPEDVEVTVTVWRGEPPDLIIQTEVGKRIVQALMEDTHWVHKDPEVSVAGIEILLTVEIRGPWYSLVVRLPRNLGSFTLGALANEFSNPHLASILEQVCKENRLFEGSEGQILRQNLRAAGGMSSDADESQTVEE